ncbi:homoserine kinase [Paenibacillus contaminans]|uniref:Homoserine kinase n=1 Tax=Paenibacillus contaminans TaxID=450362 RepID=A0A329MRI4_9BACL|nr:homoserine kinase [Paenibacillus contaminans]RAV21956.1 homoserine kinase [Paenibacillus contaminans]
MERKVRVKVPASTANLGPGFDCLGMALELYAWIEMGPSEETVIRLHGDNVKGVPVDKTNLIFEVAQLVFREAGVSMPELEIDMQSDIPLTRGLGSSASAIVGALVAANALIGNPLTKDKLLQMATALENHPDNVGASLFGGLVVAKWDGVQADLIRLEPDKRLEVLVAIPEFQLSTEKARHVLPKEVAMKDAVYNLSHSSLLVAALSTGRLDMISHAMKDALHQPYRSGLIPGMARILEEAVDHGALGIALSGAGPTLLALVDTESGRKRELEAFLTDTFGKEGVTARTLWLKPALQGAEVLTHAAESSTLFQTNQIRIPLKGEIRA